MKKETHLFFIFGSIFVGILLFFIILQTNISGFLQKAQIIEDRLKDQTIEDKNNSEILKKLEKIETSFEEFNDSLRKIEGLLVQMKQKEKTQNQKDQILSQIKAALSGLEKELENFKEKNKEIEGAISLLEEKISSFEKEKTGAKEITEIRGQDEGKIQEEKAGPLSNLIITEVCAGFDSSENEFIEIYNPNDFAVEINDENFVLEFVDSKNKKTKKKIEWRRNTIPSKSYFLFIGGDLRSDTQRIEGDAYFSSQLTSIGGVIIRKKDGGILDRVGWGEEGKEIPIYAVEFKAKLKEGGLKTGESLQRKIQNSKFVDTGNNEKDFEISLILTPKNSLGEILTFSKISPFQKIVEEKLLITEVGIGGDEYVKIFNPKHFSISLNRKYLAYYSSKREIDNPYRLWKIDKDISVLPKNSILIAIYLQENSNLTPNWQVKTKEGKPYSRPQISPNGAIGIFSCSPKENGADCKIDLVGWGKAEVFEGKPFNFSGKGKIIARKIQNSFYQDTDSNLSDFEEK
ncbi:MAG: hypothetical protein LR000_01395 [Candidatus Pacebacteria bacterium]|nr:hypothetical protein [Candidatus Paceibacterota bacterium]